MCNIYSYLGQLVGTPPAGRKIYQLALKLDDSPPRNFVVVVGFY